ncbi:MAG: CHAT domain-containing protein, partial [Acidobacteriota bacterium]
AFALAERARARALLDVLHGVGDARVAEEHRAEHRRLVEDLASLRYRMEQRRRRGAEPVAADVEAWRELTLAIDRLQHAGRDGGRIGAASTLTLDAFQRLLDPGTRALVYFLGERRSYLWRVDRDTASVHLLPPRAELESQSAAVSGDTAVFDPRGSLAAAERAERLAEVLLAPALDDGGDGGARRLVLIADGALLRLPFAALPTAGGGGPLLIERYELAHLPSASALPALRQRASSTGSSLALFADPIYAGTELARLDGSRREAEGLRRLDGIAVDARLGAAARRRAVGGDQLRGYRYLHFATHATFDGERPELSSLVLSLADADGQPLDGHLRLAEISAMSLDAELVVLSGCDTGLGRDLRGEGLLGLARAFFYAGAGRVASSLWRVEDEATAELMTRFYQHLLTDGVPPSAALRRAQLDLRQRRRYRHPFFWAAFFIQGDWLPTAPIGTR